MIKIMLSSMFTIAELHHSLIFDDIFGLGFVKPYLKPY